MPARSRQAAHHERQSTAMPPRSSPRCAGACSRARTRNRLALDAALPGRPWPSPRAWKIPTRPSAPPQAAATRVRRGPQRPRADRPVPARARQRLSPRRRRRARSAVLRSARSAIFTSFRRGPQRAGRPTNAWPAPTPSAATSPPRPGEFPEASVQISTELRRAPSTPPRRLQPLRRDGAQARQLLDDALKLHERCISIWHKQSGNRAAAGAVAAPPPRPGPCQARRGRRRHRQLPAQLLDLCEAIKDLDGISRTLFLLGAAEANAPARHPGLRPRLGRQALQVARENENLSHQEQALLGDHPACTASLAATRRRWPPCANGSRVLAKMGDRACNRGCARSGRIAELQQEMGEYAEAEMPISPA